MSDDDAKFHWAEGMKYVVEALKGSLILNGAAAVSTLTFLGNSKSADDRLVYAMIFFASGAVFSPISFAMAYLTQLQYGNQNYSIALCFHRLTYISFLLALVFFGSGVCFAARAFLEL
ncbi:hypothetical protein [Tabrizicola flagellatus]|uniref:hypothetical protein n=1 Tax=Tabrizicola flagellatus TaxID=2593021 RepID=UPI0011F2BD07|nr:hypothetical protein [Tabrizicola flagellatus]